MPSRGSTASPRSPSRSSSRRRQRGPDGRRRGRDPEAGEQALPAGVKSKVVYDATTFVDQTIREVLLTIGEAFLLVVLVVYLFLGSLRAALIPALAVPVSLIGTFAVLLALGYSANTISLLAMVLAIGIVVDDAIVVVENVERVMEERPDLTVADATKLAMREVTGPILAITLVLLSVFVPLAAIPACPACCSGNARSPSGPAW